MQQREEPDVKRTNLVKAKLLFEVIRIAGYIAAKVGAGGDVLIVILGKLFVQGRIGLGLNYSVVLFVQCNRGAGVRDKVPVVVGNEVGNQCEAKKKNAENYARCGVPGRSGGLLSLICGRFRLRRQRSPAEVEAVGTG